MHNARTWLLSGHVRANPDGKKNCIIEENDHIFTHTPQNTSPERLGCQEVINLSSALQWAVDSYRENACCGGRNIGGCGIAFVHFRSLHRPHNIPRDWLERYEKKWLEESKESELREIVSLFRFAENLSIS